MSNTEPLIVMMRIGEKRCKGDHVIECTYEELADDQSVLEPDSINEVSMRISGPALLGLWKSIEERCDRIELEASQYKEGMIPCPCCGGLKLAIVQTGDGSKWYVRCRKPDCMKSGPAGVDKADAIYKWNRMAME